MQGRIRRVIRGKGFGFLVAGDQQFFFHHSEVRGVAFKRLRSGDLVEFEVAEDSVGKNPRAREVRLISKDIAASTVAQSPAPRAAKTRLVFSGTWPVEGEPGEADSPARAFAATVEEIPEVSEADVEEPLGEEDPEFVDAGEPGSQAGSRSRRSSRAKGSRGPHRASGRRRGGSGRRGRATGRSAGQRGEGIVRNIDLQRGFGFIRTQRGDVFFDRASARGSFEGLSVGSRVRFKLSSGGKRSKATEVCPI